MSDEVDAVVAIEKDATKEALLEAADDAVEELEGDGMSKDEAIDIVFNVLDTILAFKEVGTALGGAAGAAAGAVAEAVSDEALEKIKVKVQEYERDADKIDERAAAAEAKGRTRKAERLRKRADRVRSRQEVLDEL